MIWRIGKEELKTLPMKFGVLRGENLYSTEIVLFKNLIKMLELVCLLTNKDPVGKKNNYNDENFYKYRLTKKTFTIK